MHEHDRPTIGPLTER